MSRLKDYFDRDRERNVKHHCRNLNLPPLQTVPSLPTNEGVDAIIKRLIETELIYEQSHIVEFILFQGSDYPFGPDNLRNFYKHVCKCASEKFQHFSDPETSEEAWTCVDCGRVYMDECILETTRTVYEWWLVTEFLARELDELGEVVLMGGTSSCFWGRTSHDDYPEDDEVFREIAIKYNSPGKWE